MSKLLWQKQGVAVDADIQKFLGLDSLNFLSLEGMLSSVTDMGYCLACFDGKYAVPVDDK